ncbi:hypothetical protein AVDCRST_MAG94-4350 [uncultured Leptolyngbya sp.]|uniref:Integrase catalytic domain-containing protein n=1 Tax=uncultured Leptolyngbya sp. TaxID=332963 RepID=A0A6J4N144_9CYAN|nr:hypothetical protein AVDCRST_MAG94-4350 [uncultured Leptolyngbya sp.]
MTKEAREAFHVLRATFTTAPLLAHYDQTKPLRVETDASGVGIAGIISQQAKEELKQSHWHPIAFYSRKLSPAESHYGAGDLELLAIVAAFAQWRHYCGGAQHQIEVASDHHNLQTLMTTKPLSGRLIRWYQKLQEYDLRIVHRPGRLNPADAPSRRPDYIKGANQVLEVPKWFEEAMVRPVVSPVSSPRDSGALAHCVAGTDVREHLVPQRKRHVVGLAEPAYEDPSPAFMEDLAELQRLDPWTQGQLKDMALRIGEVENQAAGPSVAKMPWHRDADGLLRHTGRLFVPMGATRTSILRAHHDDPLAGHFGARRTIDLITRKYYWPKMVEEVKEYVKSCTMCSRIKPARHKPYGLLQPLPAPRGPWTDITMDFVTGLPPSKRRREAFDAILVVVDRYTKMAHYIPTRKTIDAPELADVFLEEILRLHGVPQSIVSDRGTVFTAQFWSALCFHTKIRRKLSTAFHPQTDGQTERQNQTLEQYLRSYVNYYQDDWVSWLPMAEFSYNNSLHASIGCSPFFAQNGYNAKMDFDFSDAVKMIPGARQRAEDMAKARVILEQRLRQARKTQARYYDRKRIERIYSPGDKVWLAARNIRTTRPCEKLDFKYHGPFEVIEPVGKQAYRLHLTGTLARVHPVFHVSLLEPCQRRQGADWPEPKPLQIEGEDEYELDVILDSKLIHKRLAYLVRWKGYSAAHDEWVPAQNMEHAQEAIEQFHRDNPDKPKPLHASPLASSPRGHRRPRGSKNKNSPSAQAGTQKTTKTP